MSKSRPLSREAKASVEAQLPNFWEQGFLSGHPAAPLPFQDFATQQRRKSRSASAMGGLYGRPFLLSTPQNDKNDIWRRDRRRAVLERHRASIKWALGRGFQEPGPLWITEHRDRAFYERGVCAWSKNLWPSRWVGAVGHSLLAFGAASSRHLRSRARAGSPFRPQAAAQFRRNSSPSPGLESGLTWRFAKTKPRRLARLLSSGRACGRGAFLGWNRNIRETR